jgi:serine/threonine-protein kinase
VGTVIADKYRIEGLIGSGGMGIVLAAHHLHLGGRVALKVLAPAGVKQDGLVKRFFQEARLASRIQSEHVVRVIDVGMLPGSLPFIVMEYLEGDDLRGVLKKRGVLTIEDAIDYTLQAMEALAEAHNLGIVHRDLKPQNLFFSRRADGSALVKVLDFGISKALSPTEQDPDGALTHTRGMLGSPLYVSPEQIRSAKHVDVRSDLWSLGVILYEFLTGQPPFRGDTMPAVLASVISDTPAPLGGRVPIELQRVVLRCLEKSPDNRYSTVGALADELVHFGGSGARLSWERIRGVLARAPMPSNAGEMGVAPSANAQATPLPAPGPRSPQISHISHASPSHASQSHVSQSSHASHGSQSSHGSHGSYGSQSSHGSQSHVSQEVPAESVLELSSLEPLLTFATSHSRATPGFDPMGRPPAPSLPSPLQHSPSPPSPFAPPFVQPPAPPSPSQGGRLPSPSSPSQGGGRPPMGSAPYGAPPPPYGAPPAAYGVPPTPMFPPSAGDSPSPFASSVPSAPHLTAGAWGSNAAASTASTASTATQSPLRLKNVVVGVGGSVLVGMIAMLIVQGSGKGAKKNPGSAPVAPVETSVATAATRPEPPPAPSELAPPPTAPVAPEAQPTTPPPGEPDPVAPVASTKRPRDREKGGKGGKAGSGPSLESLIDSRR